MRTQVTVETREVGQSFGCVGVVKYANGGKRIHETEVRPYGFNDRASRAAEAWAEEHGYEIVGRASDDDLVERDKHSFYR